MNIKIEKKDKLTIQILMSYIGIFVVIAEYFKSNSNTYLTILLICWLILFFYSLINIKQTSALLCFLVSFFVFLLGREVCYTYLGLGRYYLYLEPYNNKTFLLLIISLISIFIGFILALDRVFFRIGKVRKKTEEPALQELNSYINIKYQKICQRIFYLCYLVSMIDVLLQIIKVNQNGYLAGYIGINISFDITKIFSYISNFLPVIISLYMVTGPTKKMTKIALACYEVFGIFTLFTGHRYTFISINMYIFIIFCIRHRLEGGWITLKKTVMVLVMIPAVILLMTALDSIRLGGEFRFSGIGKVIVDFLDQQGGSINVIKRIFYYEEEISDMRYTSFNNLNALLFENSIMRKIRDIKVYSGNSIEHALYGNSLAHRLSYYEYGDNYLLGHGVGSCYIAELYHDFGMIGVVIGNCMVGFILGKIGVNKLKYFFRDGILLAMITSLILMPRGDFDGFIGNVFGLYSILGIWCIWYFAKLTIRTVSKKGLFYAMEAKGDE